ncbi:MAG: molybdenum cofactor guanylyltransferase [Fervidicoccaceae archaeon]
MICGIVLSGGESRRFRELAPGIFDKALYVYEGETLLQRSVELLEKISDQVIISAGTPEKAYLYRELVGREAELVEDPPGLRGPLAGVYASLMRCAGKTALVIPVDMPFVTGSLLLELVFRARDGFLASVVAPNSNLYPVLMALPREAGLRVAGALLKAGRNRLTDFHRGYPNLYYVNLARREEWRNAVVNLNEPVLSIDESVLRGHIAGDVEIRRMSNSNNLDDFLEGQVRESIWYTLRTGDPTAEFKLYSSNGLFLLAAKALLDSNNSYERLLGEIILSGIITGGK